MHVETPPRRKHAISLTPLIDVVFILLVFFMLASNLTDWRGVGLATGTTPAELDQPPPAVAHVYADGHLVYDGSRYRPEELAAQLRPALARGDVSAVVVRPEPGVTLGPTVAALDALAGAGLGNVALGKTK